MSLISVLFVMGLMGFISVAILSWNNQKVKINQQMNVTVIADQIKLQLVGAVLSPRSWQITQAKNQNIFASFNPGSPQQKLDIYLQDSAVPYYSSTNAKAGFDLQGNPCLTFDANLGSDICPFHYDVKLVNHVYQNNNWIDTLRFELVFKPASSKLVFFNNVQKTNYNFDLTRNLNDKSVETSCIAMSGSYNQGTNSCSIQITTEKSCGQSSSFRGTSTNQPSCETSTLVPQTCPAGVAIRGFDNQGKPICGMDI